jgi:hypothetical protein
MTTAGHWAELSTLVACRHCHTYCSLCLSVWKNTATFSVHLAARSECKYDSALFMHGGNMRLLPVCSDRMQGRANWSYTCLAAGTAWKRFMFILVARRVWIDCSPIFMYEGAKLTLHLSCYIQELNGLVNYIVAKRKKLDCSSVLLHTRTKRTVHLSCCIQGLNGLFIYLAHTRTKRTVHLSCCIQGLNGLFIYLAHTRTKRTVHLSCCIQGLNGLFTYLAAYKD